MKTNTQCTTCGKSLHQSASEKRKTKEELLVAIEAQVWKYLCLGGSQMKYEDAEQEAETIRDAVAQMIETAEMFAKAKRKIQGL